MVEQFCNKQVLALSTSQACICAMWMYTTNTCIPHTACMHAWTLHTCITVTSVSHASRCTNTCCMYEWYMHACHKYYRAAALKHTPHAHWTHTHAWFASGRSVWVQCACVKCACDMCGAWVRRKCSAHAACALCDCASVEQAQVELDTGFRQYEQESQWVVLSSTTC